jgi:hypothetical protein
MQGQCQALHEAQAVAGVRTPFLPENSELKQGNLGMSKAASEVLVVLMLMWKSS